MREKTEITHYPDGRMFVRSRSTWVSLPSSRVEVVSPNPHGPVVKPQTGRALLREQLGLDSIGKRRTEP